MAHRLEFRILPSLALALSENLMCLPEGLSPRYLNTAAIYHNWYDRTRFNALASLELDFTFFKGYRLYTQAVIDQVRAPWEIDNEDSAWGILAGVEHGRPAGKGILSLSLEGAYTSPLLYRRDGVDFITIRPYKVNGVGDNLSFDYTGYPSGGDVLLLQLDASYRFPSPKSDRAALVSARLFGMIHGKMHFFISHNEEGNNADLANLKARTLSGSDDERERSFGVSLRGMYPISLPVSFLSLSAWTGLDFVLNENKFMLSGTGRGEGLVYHKAGSTADFQFILGVELKL
jgi:hypothetical protein